MKLAVLAFALPAVTAISFDDWAAAHGKIYADDAERAAREKIFRQNELLVAQLNGEGHAVFELNKFADVSSEEFASTHLSAALGAPPLSFDSMRAPPGNKTSVDAFDWRDEGAVTPVKDQGNLGSCWAFSTVQNLEGQAFLNGQPLTNFSVEQILECDASADTKAGHADCGEFGGWPYLALQYVIDAGGIRTDDDMPYCAGIPMGKDGNCLPCMPSGYSKALCGDYDDDDQIPLYCNTSTTLGQGPAGLCDSKEGMAFSITSWKASTTDEDDIASDLVATGPLSVALNAERLQFYKSGVFDPSRCPPDNLDHAVLLVGFGTESNQAYWTVKNSWGDSWGEDGYFRITRGEGTCGINTAVVSGLV